MASIQQEIASFLTTESQGLPFAQVLRKPVVALLGVTTDASEALKALEVFTVFDLATSDVFATAVKILDAGQSTKSLLYQHGEPPADLIRASVAGGTKLGQLQDSKIDVLQQVPQDKAATIAKALGISDVREFALYAPYRAAQRMLNAVYFPENNPSFNADQPSDLLPKNGEYPTERVHYTTLVMDEINLGSQAKVDIASNDFAPLDLAKLALGDSGFQHIAYGALITMSQSWFAQGVSLGHLLHSVSLAPGESTRIAVVDWTRKSKAGQTEVVQEEDQLDNETSHNRAMNEVTTATARDAQSGFSQSYQNTSAESASVAVSASASYFGMASIDVSAGYSTANTSAAADSYSTSSGSRDLASNMAQNVNDQTHQNAHSTRSRRAAVVKEVSQSEHEGISTRVLANYNHMHALTIQYYEVVQIYKTKVAVAKVDKVVFIPVKLIDFDNDDIIHRFRFTLAMASPSAAIQQAIQNLDVLELQPDPSTIFFHLDPTRTLGDFKVRPWLTQTTFTPRIGSFNTVNLQPLNTTASSGTEASVDAASVPAAGIATSQVLKPIVSDVLWNQSSQILRLGSLFNISLLHPNSESIYLPNDVAIDGIYIEAQGVAISPIFGLVAGGTRDTVSSDQPINLIDVSYISVKGSAADRSVSVHFQLQTIRSGIRAPLDLPAVSIAKGFSGLTKIVNLKAGVVKPEIKKFFNANKLFYSTAVFRSLDTSQIALLLSGYVVKVKEASPGATAGSPDVITEKLVPVSQVVEPKPIRYVGNYLAFKMNSSEGDTDWAKWLEARKLKVGYTIEDIVPLPSGGTFAEAVLGRYNCAEKLDMTRFWNWQDSPIPILPSDIAAIQAGQHNTSDNLPGTSQLSAPIINMTAPSALPDPNGTAAILSAIQNGNIFRDQSGLQATIGFAQASTQATAAAATSAGQQASVNMANTLQANTERQRIQAQKDVTMAQMSASASNNSKGGQNHSQDGAKVNYFDSMAAKNGVSSGNNAPGLNGSTSGNPSSGGRTSVNPFPTGSKQVGGSSGFLDSGSSSNPAFNAAVWSDGAPRSALFQQAMENSLNPSTQATFQNVAAFTGDENKVALWKDLLNFKVSDDIVKSLAARDITVQKIEDAMGDLNIDMYTVQIDKFPRLPGTTAPATPEEFLYYARTNLNKLIDTNISEFYPLKPDLDDEKWMSKSPVGAVIRIDIPFFRIPAGQDTMMGSWDSISVGDNAAVVCSESDANHWRLSTLQTPFNVTGRHPVSGTREWGIKPSSGGQNPSWIFYTRGVDRTTGMPETLLQDTAFAGGRKLWLSLQAGTEKFVKANGGEGKAIPSFQTVVTWPGSYWNTLNQVYSSPGFNSVML
jgi:hypothetical protein